MSEVVSTGKILLVGEVPAAPRSDSRAIGLEALTKKSLVSMSGGLLSQFLKFLVVVYVARRLAIYEFGLVSFATAVNAYMFVVSNFGLPVFGNRAVATSRGPSRSLLAEITCLRAGLAALSGIITVGVFVLVPGVTHLELKLIAIFAASNILQAGLLDWVFQGLHMQSAWAVLNILWQGCWLGLTMLGMHFGMGILAIPAALCLAALVASATSFFWLGRLNVLATHDTTPSHVIFRSWEILKQAAPLGFATLLVTFMVWTDAIVVRLIRGDQAAGLYAAGNRGALALAMLASFFVIGALPQLSQASSNPARFRSFFEHTYQDVALLFVPGLMCAMLYAPAIIQLLFKQPEYLAAVSVFRIFQLMLAVNVVSNLYGIGGLVANHLDHAYQRTLIISAVVFGALCPLLTWFWGMEGAALAVLAAQVLCLFLTLFETRNLLGFYHFKALVPPLLAGSIVVFVSRQFRLPLFEGIGVLVAMYIVLLLMRGHSNRRERLDPISLEKA